MSSSSSCIEILPHGATLRSLTLPSLPNQNLVLSLPTPHHYTTHNSPYFSETVGRVANRISGGLVPDLNGRDYRLPWNNGQNTLHGGPAGDGCWGKQEWTGPVWEERRGKRAQRWRYVSPHLEGGLPGEVTASVWYSTSVAQEDASEKEKVVLDIEYEASLTGDAAEEGIEETVVALTNHAYFNPSPGPTLEGVELDLGTHRYLPIDEHSIPTGQVASWPGVEPGVKFTLGKDSPSMDHCFILDEDARSIGVDTRDRPLRRAVTLRDPGRVAVTVETTEPAVQIYTGEGIKIRKEDDGTDVKGWEGGKGPRAGMAVEPERYVDAAGRSGVDQGWRGMVVLRRGQCWGSRSRVVASRE